MAEAIAQNNSRDLWHELNKMKPRSKIIPPHIDGCTSNREICDIFTQKYKMLFNSVPSDIGTMRDIKTRLHDRINRMDSVPSVDVTAVKEAIKRLKVSKSDGDKGFTSDMTVKAPDSWLTCLAEMISSMFHHGYYPTVLRKATITSLVKDNTGDLCNSTNYRAVALSSSINKVIDWIILLYNKDIFLTSDLQFAYKPHSSTAMCTLALRETASYYCENGGNIFCTMLDASKAFDRLRYDKLLQILEERQLDPLVLRLLLFSYEHQLTRTQWLSESSDYFTSLNGIRQGGVASPILFTLYMDELIHRLEKTNIGCFIGHEYFGVL
jgi:hypothetical protein